MTCVELHLLGKDLLQVEHNAVVVPVDDAVGSAKLYQVV